jgi:hypothetical protein
MTKLDLSQIKPIPGFDCLKWKDETQARILRDTDGMTEDEILEYFRLASERAALRRKARARRQAAESQT